MNNQKIYQVALTLVPGIGDITAKQLINYCGSAEEVFKSTPSALYKIPGIGEKIISAIKTQNVLKKAEEEIEKCIKREIRILFFTDEQYPSRLIHVPDSPALLYFKGNVDLNFSRIIGIVGTRQSTEYGKDIVYKLTKDLKRLSPLIVSGLAYGIDIHAHKAALQNNIPTIGVTASGLDYIYPAAHKDTALQMLNNGGVLTEHKLGTKPDAHNFPERNRIIAGMCDAIIVVEAAKKGGALITAEIANSYNKDVFAVPGNVGNKSSEGCNNLIKTHRANLLTCVEDLEYIMNWEPSDSTIHEKKESSNFLEDLSEEEKYLIKIIEESGGDLHMDEISWKSQIPINQIASILLNLEFKSLVKSLPGKKFRLNLL